MKLSAVLVEVKPWEKWMKNATKSGVKTVGNESNSDYAFFFHIRFQFDRKVRSHRSFSWLASRFLFLSLDFSILLFPAISGFSFHLLFHLFNTIWQFCTRNKFIHAVFLFIVYCSVINHSITNTFMSAIYSEEKIR